MSKKLSNTISPNGEYEQVNKKHIISKIKDDLTNKITNNYNKLVNRVYNISNDLDIGTDYLLKQKYILNNQKNKQDILKKEIDLKSRMIEINNNEYLRKQGIIKALLYFSIIIVIELPLILLWLNNRLSTYKLFLITSIIMLIYGSYLFWVINELNSKKYSSSTLQAMEEAGMTLLDDIYDDINNISCKK